MSKVYILEHIYEADEIEEIKFIGVFSLKTEAESAIEFLSEKQGFIDHPLDCFKISEAKLDEYEWKEGFISWEEGNMTN